MISPHSSLTLPPFTVPPEPHPSGHFGFISLPQGFYLLFFSAWDMLPMAQSHISYLCHFIPISSSESTSYHPIQNKIIPLSFFFFKTELNITSGCVLCLPLPWDVGPKRTGICLFCSLFIAWCSISICWMNGWMNKWTNKQNLKHSSPSVNVCWFEIFFFEVFVFTYLFSWTLYLVIFQTYKKLKEWSIYPPLKSRIVNILPQLPYVFVRACVCVCT